VKQLIDDNKALTTSMKTLQKKIAEFDVVVPTDDRMNVKLRREAARVIPYLYNIDVALPAGSTSAVVQSVQIEQSGAFLMYRLQCSWRPTAGANNGKFMPISAAHPAAMLAAQATTADWLSFVFTITEGEAGRLRNKNPIPGDLIYRCEEGLRLEEPDVFIATSTVEFSVSPLIAPTNPGVLTFTLHGLQLLGVIGAAS
jgi:hypothetical protein